MRKFATLSMAVLASLALAGAASATVTAAIQGSSTPGTNTYSIVLSFSTGDGITGIAVSTNTTGTYTGTFTETIPGIFPTPLPGPGPIAVGTGVRGSWGGVNGLPQVGGTFTVGTIEITGAPGDVISPFFQAADGFATTSFGTIVPSAGNMTSVTIVAVPEPTTAGLLGLGIFGLVMAGRRSRA